MVIYKHKQIKIWALILVVAIGLFGLMINSTAEAYICKSGDTECEEAKKKMQDNQKAAKNYADKADSIGEIIQQLNTEISDITKTIASNEVRIKTLNRKIAEAEEKLGEEQSALAELLVKMHFESDAEPIRILAGATSISDLAEKAAREEVVKQEIAAASDRVKAAKAELDKEKAEVEATLRENESSREVLASKKADQKELKATYEKNADDAEAIAAYWEKQVQAMAWTPPSNTSGYGSRWQGVGNSYPYQNVCNSDYAYVGSNIKYPYGGLICQCTDYASYKAKAEWGVTNTWGGHAYAYGNGAGKKVPKNGATTYVDYSPAPKTIAIWPATAQSPYGHVAWVESVNSNGSINVTEYNVNWPSIGCYTKDFCSRNGVGSAGVRFLHFE
ncbi:CHAP domain-containing protein [Candidatus Saccharibacteria bacterium]|nr:CHAP domain-containing protein [Candidatus Saccharibacteria bacterium]